MEAATATPTVVVRLLLPPLRLVEAATATPATVVDRLPLLPPLLVEAVTATPATATPATVVVPLLLPLPLVEVRPLLPPLLLVEARPPLLLPPLVEVRLLLLPLPRAVPPDSATTDRTVAGRAQTIRRFQSRRELLRRLFLRADSSRYGSPQEFSQSCVGVRRRLIMNKTETVRTQNKSQPNTVKRK